MLSEDISTSRTCRLRNVTRLRLGELIEANLHALGRVITFLERHQIRLYRISSNLIPFGSHPANELRWWEEYGEALARLGARFQAAGVRVSTHPGQYTVINSPSSATVRAAVAELEYHARLMDALGTDTSSRIVLHIGGRYVADNRAAVERFCAVAAGLPDAVTRRLVVENDDRLFHADDVLAVARRLRVPVVFDWLHHQANPGRTPLPELLPAIFATWTAADGPPKVHLSSQAAGGLSGAHADFIDVRDARAFFDVLPNVAFDCMLEAKQKDRALLKLRSALRRYRVVESHLQTPR